MLVVQSRMDDVPLLESEDVCSGVSGRVDHSLDAASKKKSRLDKQPY
jgi:hypothetical protein